MKGSYCLIIKLKKDSKIKIGKKLGFINFKEGYYVYIGSAMNSLEARLKRHLSNNKKKHWHIDYLLLNKNSKIDKIVYTNSNKKVECLIAQTIKKDAFEIADFGCSDCNCNSHLIYFNNIEESLENVEKSFKKLKLNYEVKDFQSF